MKFIIKYTFYILFFIVATIAFLPKTNIYYFALNTLKEHKIELEQLNIIDKFFEFEVENIKVKYEKAEVSNISNINTEFYIFRSSLKLENIIVNESLYKFIPKSISDISISHNILDPLKVNIISHFELGNCIGYIDLVNKIVKLEFKVSKSFKSKYKHIVKQLKISKEKSNKNEEVYTYEYKF